MPYGERPISKRHDPNSALAVKARDDLGDPQSPQRGLPSTPQQPRFIGLQTHTGQVLFRRIQWKAL